MTPARSLAASVAALGFAGALTAPQPAFAAPAPCERAENYAAQSGAELLRINKLEVRASAPERPPIKRAPEKTGVAADATDRVLGTDVDPIPDPTDSDTLSEGIGILGDAVVGGLLEGSSRAATNGGGAGGDPSAASTLEERGSTSPGGGADGGDGSADGFDGVGGGSGGQGGGTSGSGGQGGGARTGATGEDQDGTVTDEGSADGGDDRSGPATGGSQDGAGTGDDATDDGGAAEDEAGGRQDVGRTARLSDVTVGEARTAMIGNARVASAAYARVVNARSDGRSSVGEPLLQQAPPTNAEAARRGTSAGRVGPVRLGKGSIGTHARWEAGMACGRTVGETGRADASLAGVSLLSTLVRVPQKLTSSGTTALERHGDEARTVARCSEQERC